MKFTFSYEKKYLEHVTIEIPDDLEVLTEGMIIEYNDVYIANTDHRLHDADRWHVGTKFHADYNMPFFRRKVDKPLDTFHLVV